MKLDFEKFLETQDFNEDTLALIDEGIQCYKIGAYRAALLLSYYFFLKVLKDRLEKFNYEKLLEKILQENGNNEKDPVYYNKKHAWKTIIKGIQKENEWDQTIFNLIQGNKKKSSDTVFLISADLKEELKYWRRKRNACAHSKKEKISYPHVESFWLFIESNLHKFVVNGGKEDLMHKLRLHFDPKYTKPNESHAEFVQALPLVLDNPDNLPTFLKEIDTMFKENRRYPYIKEQNGPFYQFWKDVSCANNDTTRSAFIKFITSDTHIFIRFITIYPEKLLSCKHEKQLIREFWNELIFTDEAKNSPNFWQIVCAMLENNLIDPEEHPIFITELVKQSFQESLPAEQIMILKKYEYFSYLKSYLFEGNLFTKLNEGYRNANTYTTSIICYLENMPLDKQVVNSLNTLFNGLKYGALVDAFKHFIDNDESFVTEFCTIVETLKQEQQLNHELCLIITDVLKK